MVRFLVELELLFELLISFVYRNEDEAVIPNNFEESMNAQAQTCFEVKPEETERLQKFVNSIKEIVKKHRQLVTRDTSIVQLMSIS